MELNPASPSVYLLPTPLGPEEAPELTLPASTLAAIRSLKVFLAEDLRTARRFLKRCGVMPPFEGIRFYELNKHTPASEQEAIIRETEGADLGILSEAGCPGIADPGADFAALAHRQGYKVRPMTGPSSILLALMGSGLGGQSFCFHGYLPVPPGERSQRIRRLEAAAWDEGYTQIFIETPYRNESLLQDIRRTCRPQTLLTVACDLTLPTETIITLPASGWKDSTLQLKGRPSVFLIGAPVKQNRKPSKYAHKDRSY